MARGFRTFNRTFKLCLFMISANQSRPMGLFPWKSRRYICQSLIPPIPGSFDRMSLMYSKAKASRATGVRTFDCHVCNMPALICQTARKEVELHIVWGPSRAGSSLLGASFFSDLDVELGFSHIDEFIIRLGLDFRLVKLCPQFLELGLKFLDVTQKILLLDLGRLGLCLFDCFNSFHGCYLRVFLTALSFKTCFHVQECCYFIASDQAFLCVVKTLSNNSLSL